MERGDVPLEAFDKQMADINQHGFGLDLVFGSCAIQTISDDTTKKPCAQIFSEIKQINAANKPWVATGDNVLS